MVGATRRELVCERLRPELVAHLAEPPADFIVGADLELIAGVHLSPEYSLHFRWNASRRLLLVPSSRRPSSSVVPAPRFI
eukprot:11059025-Heterocapsa_arctica.AAC.1